MKVAVKSGVRLLGISPVYAIAHSAVVEAYRDFGAILCEVTSGIEGTHSWGSDHYKGDSLDYGLIRSGVVRSRWGELLTRIKRDLNEEWDVLLELDPAHIHVEWDPKRPINR